MAAKVRTISVNLNAGTAKFFTDLDQASGKIRQFGQQATQAGHAGVSSVQATSGALRTLEGNFGNNIRAVERFLATTVGLGPALQAAFPVIGGIAFGGLIVELSTKAYKFFKEMQEGPAKIAGAFRAIGDAGRLANDQLDVTNDRLANEIAKLEGHHENTLKLALDEARVAADKLADSIEKDISGINKLLTEHSVSLGQWLLGKVDTDDVKKELGGETGMGGFAGRIAALDDQGNANIHSATTEKAATEARAAMNKAILAEIGNEIARVQKLLTDAREMATHRASTFEAPVMGQFGAPVSATNEKGARDAAIRIEALQGTLHRLNEMQAFVPKQAQETELTKTKEQLEANKANSQIDKPFEDRMKAMAAQIEGVRAKLAAIGQPEAAQLIAKAFAEAQKAIAETNKALERHNTQLSDGQKAMIRLYESQIVSAEAEAEWRTKLVASETSIQDRVASLNLLTAAIGKGYEATKQANVETRLMSELGQHFNDPAWMKQHQPDVQKLRTGFGQEFDAQHNEQSAQSVDKLNDQIELERELAAAQAQGTEAVRQATLAVKIRQMTALGATKEQIQAEMELFNAQRANANAADVAKIDERIAATRRLTAAILGGTEAQRKAGLENKYAEMEHAGASPEVIQKTRQNDAAEHQNTRGDDAEKVIDSYQAQYQKLADVVALAQARLAIDKDDLAAQIALQDAMNQQLDVMIQMTLKLGTAKDGVKAFFLEMEKSAKKASDAIFDALNSAFDRTSENLAKLLTGQKASWAKEFKDIGEQMVQSTIKSSLQKGLAAIGGKLLDPHGKDKDKKDALAKSLGLNKRDGSSADLAFWVQLANGGMKPDSGPDEDADSGSSVVSSVAKSSGPGFLGIIAGLLGGAAGAAGATPSVSSSISYGGARAGGGGVEPGNAYMVNENEQEYFIPSQRGTILPHPGAGGGGVTINNHIDARGAELGAYNRIARGIEQSHQSAVAQAVQAIHERSKRVPSR